MRIDITFDCPSGVQVYTCDSPKDALRALSCMSADTYYSVVVSVWVGSRKVSWGDFYLFDRRILPVS